MVRLMAQNVGKHFNDRRVLENISFQLNSGESLVITGPNGSGKTTLIRILAGLLSPSSGNVFYEINGKQYKPYEVYPLIGLVGPYLQLYMNLTAWENLVFFSRIRGLAVRKAHLLELMERLGLAGREQDELRAYSSGMLQRMKYVVALLHQPEILMVDEPTSNLDETGVQIVYQILEDYQKDRIVIVATNEPEEVRFGRKRVDVAG